MLRNDIFIAFYVFDNERRKENNQSIISQQLTTSHVLSVMWCTIKIPFGPAMNYGWFKIHSSLHSLPIMPCAPKLTFLYSHNNFVCGLLCMFFFVLPGHVRCYHIVLYYHHHVMLSYTYILYITK